MQQEVKNERLGLGLSGGGLRASFFHIGVFAQMAEQNLLRHVEVISTVSGGSIIGALYYLHVKNLLESKADADIADQDYVEIVLKIEHDFLTAMEKNIRMATFANFAANIKMRFFNYSRSDRIAELYNEWLYQDVLQGVKNPLQMQELKILPKGGQEDFHPNKHNTSRKAKVPILELNATSLNTGRSWQFTATTMGEPPTRSEKEAVDRKSSRNIIDRKPFRLRRAGTYSNITPTQQDFPLGHAVAASAGVPGLFDPMAVSDLYRDLESETDPKEEIRAQLVDGGVHDNQGIEALLRNHCTCFVISDAAGQMGTENNPGTGAIPVLLRVSSILQDRVRTEGLLHLMDSRGKQNVAFMNLRAGLAIRQIHWIDKNGEQAKDVVIGPASSEDFDVDPKVQESLSKMRTDLDAFTEVEAYSLMLSGYRMSKDDLETFKTNTDCAHVTCTSCDRTAPETPWKFQGIEPWINNPTPEYLRQLEIAQSTFGKAMMCMPWLWGALAVFVGILLYFLGPLLVTVLTGAIPIYVLVGAVLLWIIDAMAPKLTRIFRFMKLLRPHVELVKLAFKSAGLVFSTAFIQFYQFCINPLYVSQGRLAKLIKPTKPKD